jgi:hypothetical protein
MGRGLSFLFVVLALLFSEQPLESQEFPFFGRDAYQILLRAGYSHLERFAALLVPSKNPLLADGAVTEGVGVEMGVVVVMGAEMAGRLLAVLVMEPAMAAVVPVLRTVPAMVPETAQVTAPPTLRRLRPMMLRLLLLRRVPPRLTAACHQRKLA